MAEKYGERFTPPRSLIERVAKGMLGRKSGKGWYDYSGATLQQTEGERWLRFLHPDDRERTRAAFFQAVEGVNACLD